MQFRKDFNSNSNPLNSIAGIIIMILGLLAIFYLARIVFRLLYILSPVMLIATLIIDYKVVTGYLQWIAKLFKRNIWTGIGAGILSILGFPVVTSFLLGKALFRKKIKNVEKEARKVREGEFVEYEEMDDEPIELRQLEKQKKTERPEKPESSDYDNLFE